MGYRYTNNLIHETSPYLLQHAHNPVQWHAWNEDSLQKAKEENKIILVSIGYSACHWCHVMERESFEDEATAALMNENFINIKIDREERPDIDHIYMDAVQAITGSGGWPLNVFLTPDRKPFYGGTYFPPRPAFNRASWQDVLQNISNAWKERRNEVEEQAENLIVYLNKAANFTASGKNIIDAGLTAGAGYKQCEEMCDIIMRSADKVWGGFGRAPKFPQTFSIQYLLQFYYYSKNEQALQQALLSLDKMLDGGIYDHVGGGLARYSTDEQWLAPHFEKMLYDNALLLLVLCDAFQLTGSSRYRAAIDKIIAFITEELQHENGGFYAALDADSEGEEGKFYVWEKHEIEAILGGDAEIFCEFFDVTEQGNWEGKNILRKLNSVEGFTHQRQLDPETFSTQMEKCLLKLKVERSRRVRPGLDDKVILAWNALMLKAIAKASVVLQNEIYSQLAFKNYDFTLKSFRTGKAWQMLHTWKNGAAKYPGFLDDYAYLVDALLQLYELSFDTGILQTARGICEYVIVNFSDEEDVLFFYTHTGQADVVVRKKEIYDGAIPSANSIMAHNLARLAVIFDIPSWTDRSDKMLAALLEAVTKYPTSFGVWAGFLLQRIKGIKEVSVIGNKSMIVARTIQNLYLPGKIIMAVDTKTDEFPVLKFKEPGDPALIYLCENNVCLAPFKSVEEFSNALANI